MKICSEIDKQWELVLMKRTPTIFKKTFGWAIKFRLRFEERTTWIKFFSTTTKSFIICNLFEKNRSTSQITKQLWDLVEGNFLSICSAAEATAAASVCWQNKRIHMRTSPYMVLLNLLDYLHLTLGYPVRRTRRSRMPKTIQQGCLNNHILIRIKEKRLSLYKKP